jgi:hypothetical protein
MRYDAEAREDDGHAERRESDRKQARTKPGPVDRAAQEGAAAHHEDDWEPPQERARRPAPVHATRRPSLLPGRGITRSGCRRGGKERPKEPLEHLRNRFRAPKPLPAARLRHRRFGAV